MGNGITTSVPSIILPCYPIALVERLNILMASKAAGNTGVRNEFVSVCDDFLRQNLIYKHTYKIIMLQLRNANNKKELAKINTLLEELVSSFPLRTFCENVFE